MCALNYSLYMTHGNFLLQNPEPSFLADSEHVDHPRLGALGYREHLDLSPLLTDVSPCPVAFVGIVETVHPGQPVQTVLA